MSSTTTIVTCYYRANAVSVSAHSAQTTSLHTTISNPASSVRVIAVPFWAVSSNMPRDAADVTNRIIPAVASYVTWSPAVLARLLVCAVSGEMSRFEAVVAEPEVSWTRIRIRAVSCSMSRFATRVTDSFVWTVWGYMARFSTVPTPWFRRAFCCNVPAERI